MSNNDNKPTQQTEPTPAKRRARRVTTGEPQPQVIELSDASIDTLYDLNLLMAARKIKVNAAKVADDGNQWNVG